VKAASIPARVKALEGERPKRATCSRRREQSSRVADSRVEPDPEGRGSFGSLTPGSCFAPGAVPRSLRLIAGASRAAPRVDLMSGGERRWMTAYDCARGAKL
jgi:hypothetical protein